MAFQSSSHGIEEGVRITKPENTGIYRAYHRMATFPSLLTGVSWFCGLQSFLVPADVSLVDYQCACWIAGLLAELFRSWVLLLEPLAGAPQPPRAGCSTTLRRFMTSCDTSPASPLPLGTPSPLTSRLFCLSKSAKQEREWTDLQCLLALRVDELPYSPSFTQLPFITQPSPICHDSMSPYPKVRNAAKASAESVYTE